MPRPYDAFISYSHAADGMLAPAIRTGLERLARRWTRRKALSVFHDGSGLAATPTLWATIQGALDSSRFFVLLASPAAAASDWVNREVSHFAARSPGALLIALTDGDCRWDGPKNDFDWARTNAVPGALRGRFAEEPLWVDLRWARTSTQLDLRNPEFRTAIAGLAAPIHGIPRDDLDAIDLHEHRKARRVRRTAVVGLAALTATSAVGAGVALDQGREARHQRDAALEASRRSDAQRLAVLSSSLAETNTDVALLLAMHSRERAPSSEGVHALARAVTEPAANMGTIPDSFGGGLSIATSRSGDRLAWTTDADEVVVYDVPGQRIAATVPPPEPVSVDTAQGINELSLAADGSAVVATVNNWDELWYADLSATDPVFEPLADEGMREAAFGLATERLAVMTDNGVVSIYDTASGELVSQTQAIGSDARTLAWSDTDDQLAVATATKVVVVDPDDGSTITSFDLPAGSASAEAALDIAFSTSGQFLAVGGTDGVARIWRLDDQSLVSELRGHLGQIRRIAWALDDETIATAGLDTSVRIWDVGNGKPVGELRAHSWGVSGLVYSGDGNTLYTSTTGEGVRRWDLRTGRPSGVYYGHKSPVIAVAVSPDSRYLATNSADVTYIWDLESDEPIATLQDALAYDATFDPTGERLAIVGGDGTDGTVRVYDAESGDLLATLTRRDDRISRLAYSPDGQLIVIGDDSGTVTALDSATGEERWAFAAHEGAIVDIEFAPDGSFVASASMDGSARWFDPSTGDRLGRWEGEERAQVAIRPDSGLIAISAHSGVVTLVDPVTGSERFRFAAHQNNIYELAFSPDGTMLVTAAFNNGGLADVTNFDGGLRLWDAGTGVRLAELVYHDSQVEDVTFSDDGRWLVSGGADGDIALWPGPTQWPVLACEYAGRELTAAERDRYLDPAASELHVCDSDPIRAAATAMYGG